MLGIFNQQLGQRWVTLGRSQPDCVLKCWDVLGLNWADWASSLLTSRRLKITLHFLGLMDTLLSIEAMGLTQKSERQMCING